jgi:hypothetical protein
MHSQYDWFRLCGLYRKWFVVWMVRLQAGGSTTLTMIMHGIANLWATLETVARWNCSLAGVLPAAGQ